MNVNSKYLAGAVAAMALISGSAGADTVLTLNNWLPPTHPLVSDVLKPWADDVADATEGRVTINILPAPLGPPPASYDLAKNGVADITYALQGYTPGRFATSVLAEMPFLSDNAIASSVAFWRVHDEMLEAAGEYEGVKVVSVFTHGPGEIFTHDEVTSVEDLEGLKIRVGGTMAHDIATNLDAVPVEGPSSQAYELLSQGVADGIFFPFETVTFFGLESLLSNVYTIDGGLYNSAFFLVMNGAKWDSIPAEDQALIEPLMGEAFARRAGEMWNAQDAKARAAMEGSIAFTAASDADVQALRARLEPVVQERIEQVSATGIDGQAAYDRLLGEIANVEAE